MKSEIEPTTIDRLAQFLERFVFFKDKSLYLLIALWVIATYKTQLFEYTGYLFAYSPETECGKSRLLEVLDQLVFNSSEILISPSTALLFRTAHGTTQILDEIDSWPNHDDLRGVLNAGFKKGAVVKRLHRDEKGEYQEVKFPVYAPRALAGIGLRILSDTTRDRTFALEMLRQTKEEKREKFRLRKLRDQMNDLREEIELFSIVEEDKVVELYDNDQGFPYLEKFRDRTIDIAEPLAAILEATYEGHPELEKVRENFLEAIAITRDDQQEELKDHRIIRHLMDQAEEEGELIGNATELAEKCSSLPEKPSQFEVSTVLRKYGFTTKSQRKDGVPKYRYVLSYEELREIIERYGSSSQEDSEEV
ncbi:hypothetical protein MYX82_14310 [Acidobacteria bacterium AH-259-D05]|nr:hypothetical protein [Acidobacteria bacterium AH-259-D05]